jgi:quinol monooxygenase YgiN
VEVKNKVAITINIYYTGKNGSALKFAEEMVSSGVVSDIRAEDGNIRYDYFSPLNDPETVLLIDSWENQKAIDIHHASPMMEQITRLREKYNLSMKVERYISDEAGIPHADKKYIEFHA